MTDFDLISRLALSEPEHALADEFRELDDLRRSLNLDHAGVRYDTPLGPVEIWQDASGQRVIISGGRELRLS